MKSDVGKRLSGNGVWFADPVRLLLSPRPHAEGDVEGVQTTAHLNAGVWV